MARISVRTRPYRKLDLASASQTLKNAFTDDPVMRAMDPDDQIWERDAARNFGWFCWINSASFSMAEVAVFDDVSGDDDNDVALCVALWVVVYASCSSSCTFSGRAASPTRNASS